jgi:hypothetical protein
VLGWQHLTSTIHQVTLKESLVWQSNPDSAVHEQSTWLMLMALRAVVLCHNAT